MDAIRGYTADVLFPVPSDLATARFKVFRDGEQIGLIGNATVANGLATVTLPYSSTLTEGEVDVNLLFTYQAEPVCLEKRVRVITPLLDKYEILDIHPNATDKEVWSIESAVRNIIQSHTGQEFGFFYGSKTVAGTGGPLLVLPAHLLSVDSVNSLASENQFQIVSDGWALRQWSWGIPPVKADYYGWSYTTGGVIHYPDDTYSYPPQSWTRGLSFDVIGDWGYYNVPEPVKEAAKLLINDYACGDAQYRDRFLTSMTAADWRIQFNSGAFRETGNVRADQLLNAYVLKGGWAVL